MHEQLLWHTNSDFYGIRTPTFTPYEPFLLGVGVVFNILRVGLAYNPGHHPPENLRKINDWASPNLRLPRCVFRDLRCGRLIFTTTGADESGRSTGKKSVLAIIFLEIAREVHKNYYQYWF